MGLKIIFEEERQFFKNRTGYELPTDCWRDASKIYLDITCKKPLLTFKVINKEIKIIKDNTKLFVEYKQLKIDELIEINKVKIFDLFNKSISDTYDYVVANPNKYYIVSHSSGKDSDLTYIVWLEMLKVLEANEPEIFNNLRWIINFANTSNDTADTYKKIKTLPKDRLHILNPKIGWRTWQIKVKKYFISTTMTRNCCSTYKEGQITKAYDKNEEVVNVLGVRCHESAKRSDYVFKMDNDWRIEHFTISTLPEKWINIAPIVDWYDEDVWLYLVANNISFNRMYKLGFGRVGCLLCPFQQDYVDLLIEEYYPQQWKWWEGILEKNYELWGIAKSLKWTLNEWKTGRWKQGTSKEYEITKNKMTPARVTELAELKGISEKMAEKYFKKTCGCGKNMNPTELSMFYKVYGRFEDVDDNRELLCKKCFCEKQGITKKEYTKMSIEFLDSGCKLF